MFITTADQIAVVNTIIQTATLVLGLFAAYYALRQLVETRFISLDNAGMNELKLIHYSRAFEKWKEALYIKPELNVFSNMCEALLLMGDYETFDGYMKKPLNMDTIEESSEKIILLYLKTVRHLLVRNQGVAETYITEIVQLAEEDGLESFNWDFRDLQTSVSYQNLRPGDCKFIIDNLISYLSQTIQPTRKTDFENGNFASQISEVTEEVTTQTPAVPLSQIIPPIVPVVNA